MIYDIDIAKQIAKSLLQINAIILQPEKPFVWASKWNSPIYCDNRKTLSYPEIRNYIREVNKQIHGNYAHDDRMVMQSTALGELAAQFHKWVAKNLI